MYKLSKKPAAPPAAAASSATASAAAITQGGASTGSSAAASPPQTPVSFDSAFALSRVFWPLRAASCAPRPAEAPVLGACGAGCWGHGSEASSHRGTRSAVRLECPLSLGCVSAGYKLGQRHSFNPQPSAPMLHVVRRRMYEFIPGGYLYTANSESFAQL